MAEKSKQTVPPYAAFSAFTSFLNKLRDTSVPSRIDPTVFGNASGSLSYSIITSLKSLKLIDAEGKPLPQFIKLVNSSDEARKELLGQIVRQSYPSLFEGKIDIAKATAGQLDEHIRTEYGIAGSTVDKVATFFIQAAQYAGIELSAHIKARKPIATSASAGKSRKQRRSAEEPDGSEDPPPPPQFTPAEAKALEYQLIDLMTEGVGEEEQTAIWTLVRFLTAKKKAAG